MNLIRLKTQRVSNISRLVLDSSTSDGVRN